LGTSGDEPHAVLVFKSSRDNFVLNRVVMAEGRASRSRWFRIGREIELIHWKQVNERAVPAVIRTHLIVNRIVQLRFLFPIDVVDHTAFHGYRFSQKLLSYQETISTPYNAS
jgi:hypothetical protein